MITAIIVTYNTGNALYECVDSVKNNKFISEIILVDNGNPKGFLEKINNVNIITGHGNIGFGKACNLGVKNSNNEFILLINPDCIIANDFDFSDMIKDLETENILCATCKIENKDGTEQKGSRRKLLTPLNLFTGFNLHKTPLPQEKCFIEATSGAFMLFKKHDFNMLGGFDENYFLHVEDLDICMKIKQIGGKIIYYPYLNVKHYLSTSDSPKKIVEKHKLNSLRYYFIKFFGSNLLTETILILLFVRFYLKFIASK